MIIIILWLILKVRLLTAVRKRVITVTAYMIHRGERIRSHFSYNFVISTATHCRLELRMRLLNILLLWCIEIDCLITITIHRERIFYNCLTTTTCFTNGGIIIIVVIIFDAVVAIIIVVAAVVIVAVVVDDAIAILRPNSL